MFVIAVEGTSRDVSTIAASQALSALVVLLALSLVGAWWIDRSERSRRGVASWFAGFASIALIVAVTMFREGFPTMFRPAGIVDWSTEGLSRLSNDPLGSSQFVLNVLLFVPAGVVWTWISKRPLAVLAALVAGSFLIESTQGVTGAGATDVADLIANGLGAAIGVGVIALVGDIVRTRGLVLSSRSRRLAGAAVAGVVALLITGWFVGASQRQQSVERELRDRFAGTTRTDFDSWLADGEEERIWSAIAARADGTRYLDDAVEVRYPATFFSLHRCVFVTWTDTSVEFTKASGHDCAEFIG